MCTLETEIYLRDSRGAKSEVSAVEVLVVATRTIPAEQEGFVKMMHSLVERLERLDEQEIGVGTIEIQRNQLSVINVERKVILLGAVLQAERGCEFKWTSECIHALDELIKSYTLINDNPSYCTITGVINFVFNLSFVELE